MTAQELKQMRDDDIIGFHRLLPPFKARRLDWRRHPLLIQRQRIPPPQLRKLPQPENQRANIIWEATKWGETKKAFLDPDKRGN
jgi:type IV secretory pathway TraG/TraD family ATPase VirD4